MKAQINLEVEKEEDLKQVKTELEAALAHTPYIDGDVEVNGVEKQ